MGELTEIRPHTPAATPVSGEDLAAELEKARERAREIDHRARNSLQLVGSLVMLAGRRTAAPETQRLLKSLHQRIGAIGAVHRGFMDSPSPDRFDLARHLRDQIATVARTAPPEAELRLDIEAVEVASAAAVPLALIVQELTANALAHSGPAPKVAVSLKRDGDGLRLAVGDRGPGLAADREAQGFGLTIVRLMAQQLRAELAFEDAQPGLQAIVRMA
jgi:two-component sensor histidine kinase